MAHCSCAELPQCDAAHSDEHTPVTRRYRHAHTVAFSAPPSTRGIPSYHPTPTAPLPRTTAPPPNLSPPTAAARYIVQCITCTPLLLWQLLHYTVVYIVNLKCLPSSSDSHLFHYTQPAHVPSTSPLYMCVCWARLVPCLHDPCSESLH